MPNLWRQFKALLPEAPLQIGTVVGRNADGSLSVNLLGGGQLRVSGSAEPGARVFVRDGAITGEAPELPSIDIEI